jgi:hypothetical protein
MPHQQRALSIGSIGSSCMSFGRDAVPDVGGWDGFVFDVRAVYVYDAVLTIPFYSATQAVMP